MRLINADTLRTKAYTAVMLEPDENNRDYVKGTRKVVDLDDIDNAPILDAEWQFISENYWDVIYSCTKCGRFFVMPKGKYNDAVKLAPYCHCGAKMIRKVAEE